MLKIKREIEELYVLRYTLCKGTHFVIATQHKLLTS
jgi:hypothetical protein